MLLVIAFIVFSWGIWQARVGFGDDTGPVYGALRAVEDGHYSRDLYELGYILLLRFVTPDPVPAALVMRTVVSLMTTLVLYYVLLAFRPYVHRRAVLIACAIWMVTHLNAPLVQYSNLSPFTFCIAALGLGWLLRRRSWTGLLGYLFTSAIAATLRVEYLAPALTIGSVVGIWLLWTQLRPRVGRLWWGGIAAAALLAVIVIAPRFRGNGGMDRYLLFGLGQCYAAFYKAEHPELPFHPMTEYRELLDGTFGHPTSFFGALAHNPREAFRYFALNSLHNLEALPVALLSTRHTAVPSSHLKDRFHSVFLAGGLLAGGVLLGWRIRKQIRHEDEAKEPWYRTHATLLGQLLLLVLFVSASSVAIVMLVPSPRYWISWVPVIYLGVAACFDALLRLHVLRRHPWLLWGPALVLFCRPLFLGLGDNENHEVSALRQIAPRLAANPVIAGVYTRPYQAYAFRGHAVSVNAGADLEVAGVREGRYDVLIVDSGMRSSRVWNENLAFFEAFELNPAATGYVKLTEAFTGRRDIYYRPKASAGSVNP